MEAEDNNDDYQMEFDDDEEFNSNRKTSQNIVRDKTPPNIQMKPPGTKQKRRSKNDCKGRDYQCGCGKTYLSYPALYTHIKTKHHGKTPDGTNANQIQNKIKGRGRPRKNFLNHDDTGKKREMLLDGDIDELHPDLKEFYGKSSLTSYDFIKKQDVYLNVYSMYREDEESDYEYEFKDVFPPSALAPIYGLTNSYNELYKSIEKWQISLNESQLEDTKILKDYSCDDLMSLFLLSYKDIFSIKLMKKHILYFYHLRNYLNKFGWDFISDLEDVSKYPTHKNITEVFSGWIIPEMLKEFIDVYLPQRVSVFERYLKLLISTHFCDWLKKYGVTQIDLTLK